MPKVHKRSYAFTSSQRSGFDSLALLLRTQKVGTAQQQEAVTLESISLALGNFPSSTHIPRRESFEIASLYFGFKIAYPNNLWRNPLTCMLGYGYLIQSFV